MNRGSFLKIQFLLLLLFSAVTLASAQTRTVTGTITSAEDNSPLPGANVFVKGTTRGTVTNLDGLYTIDLQPGDEILVFSYIGYKDQEISAASQSVIDVVLAPQPIGIDEIVVIGYGTIRKSDLTGSVSSVKADDLVKITSVNPEQSLQGKVAGVNVTSTSGAPGAGPVVRVRGVGTFNNSSPIFVVDGVILDNISFLNSGDIASM
jgi:S-adenosylhomocysteine hydrolase